jgi:FSR family fosmidomycin resistance protein-like MFS transporter
MSRARDDRAQQRPSRARRGPAGSPPQTVNRRGIALISLSHVVDDLYQGVVPALLPFLVAERQYSYAAISGLTLAGNVLSSVAQPAFGWWSDRGGRRWLIPAGMLTAAVGVALAGLTPSYGLTWVVIAISGLGIAAFHPAAARAARQAAGRSNRAMSIFSLGGNAGFALGSLVATPVLLWAGLRGTVLLVLPAVAMAAILALRLGRVLDGPDRRGRHRANLPTGTDDWRSFGRLTAVVVVRSVMFFGITSFLALYFIEHLHTSQAVGGAALTVFLFSGATGTLIGGWMGDRFGPLVSIRVGLALVVPAMAGIVLAGSTAVAFLCVVAAGIASFLPFSVFVMLGQDYLPNRVGTASGVTVGLSVSIGGLFNPLLGTLADHTSLRTTLAVLIVAPALALVLSAFLRDPVREDRGETTVAPPADVSGTRAGDPLPPAEEVIATGADDPPAGEVIGTGAGDPVPPGADITGQR